MMRLTWGRPKAGPNYPIFEVWVWGSKILRLAENCGIKYRLEWTPCVGWVWYYQSVIGTWEESAMNHGYIGPSI